MNRVLRYNVVRKGTGQVHGAYATLRGAEYAKMTAQELYGTAYVVEARRESMTIRSAGKLRKGKTLHKG